MFVIMLLKALGQPYCLTLQYNTVIVLRNNLLKAEGIEITCFHKSPNTLKASSNCLQQHTLQNDARWVKKKQPKVYVLFHQNNTGLWVAAPCIFQCSAKFPLWNETTSCSSVACKKGKHRSLSSFSFFITGTGLVSSWSFRICNSEERRHISNMV